MAVVVAVVVVDVACYGSGVASVCCGTSGYCGDCGCLVVVA